MIIVYHDFGGTHSTALAAAIHLGIVGKNGATSVSADELLNRVPYFDQVPGHCKGTVMHVGRDSAGHEVYILGRRRNADLAINAVLSACRFIGKCQAEFMFVDVSKRVNWLMRIGGFLSRGLGMVQLGRPIVVKGTQIAYPSIARLVDKTRQSIQLHADRLRSPEA
ncbi:MAG: DUF3189 family protein [Firmicutes bacterium]|nr:DUF3189 family protein [Bacillota bacterium]